MATKSKSSIDSSEAKNIEAVDVKPAPSPIESKPASKYPAVRVLSGAELEAYKTQKVDPELAERFLAQKDKEEYWRNKKDQRKKKTEG